MVQYQRPISRPHVVVLHLLLRVFFLLTCFASTVPAFTYRSLLIVHRAQVPQGFGQETDEASKTLAAARQLLAQGTADSISAAIEKFKHAAQLFRSAGNSLGESAALINLASAEIALGSIFERAGEIDKALDNYNQALVIQRQITDRRGESVSLTAVGRLYHSAGERHRALELFNQALNIARELADHDREGVVLNEIGLVYKNLGEVQQALDSYNQSLQLRRKLANRAGEAITLSNIGLLYAELGEPARALDYYRQALTIQRSIGAHSGESVTLNNIASAYEDLEDLQNAIDFYNQSLPIARAVGDREQEAVVLTNIGRVYGTLGERRGALDRYETALQIFRSLGLRPAEATLLNNIGLIYSEMGQNDKAVEYYEQALNLNRAVKNSGGEALALYNIAFAEQEGDHLDEALARIQEAVGIVESLRIKIGAERLRASYFSTVQNYFDLYILILMRLHQQRPAGGYSNLALQASEQRRARALLEMLTEARADIRAGVDAQLLDRERSLVNALNSRAQMQMKLLARTSSEQQAAVIEQEIQKLTAELQQVEGEIRQKSPNYAALTQPRPLSVSEIQTQVVDADTVLLEYSLGVDRSYLWMVTPNAVTSYELPAREEIETAARELYELLKSADKWSGGSVDALRGGNRQLERETAAKPNPSIDPTKRSVPEVATRLTQMLLGPAALQIKGKRLLIVADGALQYIPFGALPVVAAESTETGYRPLLADHEIVTLPSASTIAVLRTEMTNRKPVDKSIALLADPVFESDDERVKTSVKATQSGSNAAKQRFRGVGFDRAASDAQIGGAGLRIPRLPATRDEAKRILALVPASASKQALDFNASRQTATSEELSHYRFVHFATHGFLDSVHPELSGIVLSLVDENGNPQDGFLRAHEVFNLKLPADLVVLSACQTGLGKEVRGEGLVGLTRGFMYAGAPRVVVSLWSVNDQATAELMARFYRGMLVEKLPPSAALRAAQISLMKEKQWQAPFYWAAFTLQGEWK